ncbi:PPM family protein phosphatase [Candidatus Magnetomoraceae bacterium gMMP-15]
MDKEERTQTGPPVPRLQAGHLINNEIEISNLMMSDEQKNVYSGQIDLEPVIVLERYCKEDMEFYDDIPDGCSYLFPIHRYNYKNNDKFYIVFNDFNKLCLDESKLKCWEPDLIEFLFNFASALIKLDENQIDLSEITLKDIYFIDSEIKFFIFPKKKEPGQELDEVILNFIKIIFYYKVKPNLTRNLENPVYSFCFSDEFQNILENYIDKNISLEDLFLNLKERVELPFINWDIYSATDVGQSRDHNEDACGWILGTMNTYLNSYNYTALAVSDGMGGHKKGEIASHFTLTQWFKKLSENLLINPPENFENPFLKILIEKTFDKTAEQLLTHNEFKSFPSNLHPGATLVSAIIMDRLVFIGNCGDSRAYLIYANKIERITKDHSIVQLYLDRGEITEEQAFEHEQSNYITSFMGIEFKLFKRDTYIRYLKKGTALLLCSDGLSGMLTDREILEIVRSSKNSEDGVKRLISEANARGGNDNISIILMKEEKH